MRYFLSLFLFISTYAHAQVTKIFNNSAWDLNTFNLSAINASDSVFRMGSVGIKAFKSLTGITESGSDSSNLMATTAFVKRSAASGAPAVNILLPDDIYAIEGVEFNLYNREIIRTDYGFGDLKFDFTCTKGRQYDERFNYTPVAADSGTYTFTADIYYKNIRIATKSSSLHVTKRSAGTGTRNIITIGDSQIQSGAVVDTIKTDYGSDVFVLNFTGTQQTIGGNFMEGRRGWTWNDYTTFGRTFYKFVTTGVVVRPVLNSVYTNNGSTWTIQEVNFTNGQSIISAIRTAGSNNPTASGTLTKTSGNGDATISFTSWTQGSANPFWNEAAGRMDIASYLSTNGLSMSVNDWWTIELGTNDVNTTDTAALTAAINNALIKADTMIAAIKADVPGARICIVVNTFEGTNDGSGNTNLAGITAWQHGDNLRRYTGSVLAKYNNATYRSQGIYILAANGNLDTRNNMTTTVRKINARTPETQVIQTDYLHPANIGYAQVSDVYYSFLKWFK